MKHGKERGIILRLHYSDKVDRGFGLYQNWASSSKGYGLFDAQGQMLLPYKYDEIQYFDSAGYAWVRKDGRWGLVDKGGHFRVNLQYDQVGSFVDGACWVRKNGLWGRIDHQGNILTPFQFQGHHPVKAVLVVEADGRFGAIDTQGRLVVPFEYDSIEEQKLWKHGYACWSNQDFEGKSIALANREKEFWLLDSYGRLRYDEPFTSMFCQVRCDTFPCHNRDFCYREKRLFVQKRKDPSKPVDIRNSLMGIYDVELEDFVAPCIYDRIAFKDPVFFFDYSYPYCVALRDGKEVLLDMQGKETMPLLYDEITYSPDYLEEEYLFPARKDGLWGYINAKGLVKIPFRYRKAGPFENGIAEVIYGSIHDGVPVDDLTNDRDIVVRIDHHGREVDHPTN